MEGYNNCTKTFLFVLNPIAGGIKKEGIPGQILNFCKESSCLYRVFYTSGKNDLQALKHVFDEIRPDAVIAIGGDGTIHLVGSLLLNTSIPMGIIPLGSSNGLAKNLGIPLKIDDAFKVIEGFKYKAIDTLKINGLNCFHLSDFGFNARICHRFAASLMRGKLSYLWYGSQEFFRYKSFPYEIRSDSDQLNGEAFMIVITNAKNFGKKLTINPFGQNDDGWFEINILKPFPRVLGPYIFYHMANNTIHKTKYYHTIRCQKAMIYNEAGEMLHIDGEPISTKREIEVRINPRALNIILPL